MEEQPLNVLDMLLSGDIACHDVMKDTFLCMHITDIVNAKGVKNSWKNFILEHKLEEKWGKQQRSYYYERG